jgi:hypothetical protein
MSAMARYMTEYADKKEKLQSLQKSICGLEEIIKKCLPNTFFSKFDMLQMHMIINQPANMILPREVMQIIFNFADPVFICATKPYYVYMHLLTREYTSVTNIPCCLCGDDLIYSADETEHICPCGTFDDSDDPIHFCSMCNHPFEETQSFACKYLYNKRGELDVPCNIRTCKQCSLLNEENPLFKHIKYIGDERMPTLKIAEYDTYANVMHKDGLMYSRLCKDHTQILLNK